MRVLHAPLSALALAAAFAVAGAGEALAQQPTTRPRADTTRMGIPGDTARGAMRGATGDTTRGGRTTTASAGEVTSLAGASAAPIVASLRTDAHAMGLLHESNLGEIAASQRALREAGDSAVRAFAQMMITDHTALDAQQMELGQRLSVTPALPDSALPQLQRTELQALPGDTTAAPAASASPMSPMSPSPTTRPDSAARPDSTAMPMPRTTGTDSTVRSPAGMPTTGATGATGAAGSMGGGRANAFDRAYLAQQVIAHARTLALVDAAIARGTQAELKTMLQSQVRPKVAQHLQQAQELQRKTGSQ
jgi:predicted outer membrane protein